MRHPRRWARRLIVIWPVLVALVAIATVSHDIAMATHTHESLSPARVIEVNIAHALTGVHDDLPHEAELAAHLPSTDSTCPTDFCPELIDCGLARVTNPIPAPDIHRLAAGLIDTGSCLFRVTGAEGPASSIEPVHPPGVRRALLQVFLN